MSGEANLGGSREAGHEDDAEAFRECCALPLEDKQRLFAYCIAQTVRAQLATGTGGSTALEIAAKRIPFTVRGHWQPDADFLARLTKAQLLAIGAPIHGETWASAHTGSKKGVLVDLLAETFDPASARYGAPEVRERADRWLPDGLAFPAAVTAAAADDEIQAAS